MYVKTLMAGWLFVLLQLNRGGIAKAKGEGEKEKDCTTERKSWALLFQDQDQSWCKGRTSEAMYRSNDLSFHLKPVE